MCPPFVLFNLKRCGQGSRSQKHAQFENLSVPCLEYLKIDKFSKNALLFIGRHTKSLVLFFLVALSVCYRGG